MARIAGVDLPRNKRVDIALTYIYGIGRTMAKQILESTNIDWKTNSDDLTADEVNQIRVEIENNYKVEGDLRREITTKIKRLMDNGCYRGRPGRGQKSKTNARTRKGPRRSVMGRKKK